MGDVSINQSIDQSIHSLLHQHLPPTPPMYDDSWYTAFVPRAVKPAPPSPTSSASTQHRRRESLLGPPQPKVSPPQEPCETGGLMWIDIDERCCRRLPLTAGAQKALPRKPRPSTAPRLPLSPVAQSRTVTSTPSPAPMSSASTSTTTSPSSPPPAQSPMNSSPRSSTSPPGMPTSALTCSTPAMTTTRATTPVCS
jgi:hypothetical protein